MKKPRKHENTKFSFFVPSYFRVFVVLLLFIVLLPLHEVRAEDDIHGSAHLTHTSTDTETGGEKTSSWQFTQVYNLGVSKALTPKVGFTADLDVNVTESNDEKTTRLSPDLRLDVTNEYFDANTGYRINERGLDILTMVSDEDRYTTESWNANISTRSEKYPRVRLRYSEDKDYDYLPVHVTDSKTTNFSGSTDYTFRFLNFNYEYRENTTDNYVDESIQETDTHDGRVNFRKSFLDNKITSSGSYSITNRKTETEARGGAFSDDLERFPSTGWSGVGSSTTAVPTWTEEGELTDDIFVKTTPEINLNVAGLNYQNIRIDLNATSDVRKVYLHTSFGTSPSRTINEADFSWVVYYSDDTDFTTWTQIPGGTSFEYDSTTSRFEISFAKTRARYFRVVNTNNDSADLFITEIEAYDVTTYAAHTTTETERTTETIQASLGYKPTDRLSFTYDFTQDDQKTEPDDQKTTRETHNVSGRVERELHKYLTAWAQYRRRWENDSEADDTTTDTYLLHFLSSPLDTLDTDLSFNHTVSKEESETRSRSSSALFQLAARLREGADFDVDANITRTENLASQSETTTKSLDSNLRLELTRMLTAEIEYNWNWTDTEQPSGDTTGRTSYAKTTLYWRPSHEFYFRGSYSIDRNEISGEETTQQQYNMSWLMTEKMQLDMGYTVDKNDTDTLTYSSDLSWNLSRVLTLRFGYDWSRQETDTTTETQTITSDLSARF